MSKRAARGVAARRTKMAVVIAIVGGGAACNAISGVDEIDFTRAPGTGAGDGTGGNAAGAGGTVGAGGTAGVGGGTGGSGDGTYDITCGDGNVAVGIFGRSGSWMDRLGLICAPLDGDGNLGATFQTDSTGGDGGMPGDAICPADQVLVGIELWQDTTVVRRIDLHCQTVAQWKMNDMNTTTVPGIGTAALGQEFAVVCPAGAVIYRFSGKSDMYVSNVNPLCRGV
jgi:hypothetical protein